jgi:hemerythrin-like metal-binding protein
MDAALLGWTDSLETGIAEIDAQHRELFRCVARVRDAAFADDAAEMDRTVTFLRAYVDEHFRTEEAFMAAKRYPGLARHRLEHAALLEAVAEIAADHALRGAGANSLARVERFLSDWLRTHIGVTDQALARFVRRARPG